MHSEYADWLTPDARKHLHALQDAAGNPRAYQETMHALGTDLGKRLLKLLPKRGDVLVVCTVEDADFLARGLLEELEFAKRETKLACFWNERDVIGSREVAPIIARYEEPLEGATLSAVVVVKSIIFGACVVRTNLTEVLEKVPHDKAVFVVAPVMFANAAASLESEFPKRIAQRFEYVFCARDAEKSEDGKTVVPGIGGNVYELLGLGDEQQKNRRRPRLLTARMAKMKS
jgi:hypothetical protein